MWAVLFKTGLPTTRNADHPGIEPGTSGVRFRRNCLIVLAVNTTCGERESNPRCRNT